MELGSFRSDAEDGFAETVNRVGGSFEGWAVDLSLGQ